MNRRSILSASALAIPAALVAGCAKIESAVTTGATDLALTSSEATALYGIVKGIAGVATVAFPALAPVSVAAFAIMDPIAGKIAANIATAEEVATLVTTATTLTIALAPKITVTGHA